MVFDVESSAVDIRFFEIESSVPRKVIRELSPRRGQANRERNSVFPQRGKVLGVTQTGFSSVVPFFPENAIFLDVVPFFSRLLLGLMFI